MVGILFFGQVGAGGLSLMRELADLDWASPFFESLGERRLDLQKFLGAGSWIIPGCEVCQLSLLAFFVFWFFVVVVFFLSWYGFPLDFWSIFCLEVKYAEHVEDVHLFCPGES